MRSALSGQYLSFLMLNASNGSLSTHSQRGPSLFNSFEMSQRGIRIGLKFCRDTGVSESQRPARHPFRFN